MHACLEDAGYDTGLDMEAVSEVDEYFRKLKPSRAPDHGILEYVDVNVLEHHIPGGMISNLRSQLQQQGALDRLGEVLAELPRVRADMGYPPLVTPTSQIVGVQSVLNVLGGERYGMVPQETRDYVKGLYGRPPAPIAPKLVKKILGSEKRVTVRPADMLSPGLPAAAADLDPKLTHDEEDLVTYCLFPEVALGYFKWRALPAENRPPSPADAEQLAAQATSPATAAPTDEAARGGDAATARYAAIGRNLSELFRQMGASLPEGEELPATTVTPPPPAPAPAASVAAPAQPAGETINAPLNGTFYRTPGPGKPNFADEGAALKSGDAVCVVEAMKLFNQIKAPKACKVVKFLAEHGAHVIKGQPLAVIAAV